MDVKKLAKISLSCSDLDDVEINRIMQDKTSRKVFMDIRVIHHALLVDNNSND